MLPFTPALAATDCSEAIQLALDAAAATALRTGQGVAVYMPPGVYRLEKPVTINVTGVVLRGAGVSGRKACCQPCAFWQRAAHTLT